MLPLSSSELDTAALSARASCSCRTDSTSEGPIRYEELLITSSARPTNQKEPSLSR